jgi:hypothetical protein
VKVIAWLAVAIAAAGCATWNGILEEQKTDAKLAKYLRPVRYAGPPEKLARFVLDDLRQHERRHRESNFVHRINVAAGLPTATITGSRRSLRLIGAVLADDTRRERVETLDIASDPASASDGPLRIEFRSARETYVMLEEGEGFVVAVQNRGDGDRLFRRELAFLRRVDPPRARAVQTKILAEYPEIVLDPWQ